VSDGLLPRAFKELHRYVYVCVYICIYVCNGLRWSAAL
jgi:hypothetical protein